MKDELNYFDQVIVENLDQRAHYVLVDLGRQTKTPLAPMNVDHFTDVEGKEGWHIRVIPKSGAAWQSSMAYPTKDAVYIEVERINCAVDDMERSIRGLPPRRRNS